MAVKCLISFAFINFNTSFAYWFLKLLLNLFTDEVFWIFLVYIVKEWTDIYDSYF